VALPFLDQQSQPPKNQVFAVIPVCDDDPDTESRSFAVLPSRCKRMEGIEGFIQGFFFFRRGHLLR
jgi:hypothetical protein